MREILLRGLWMRELRLGRRYVGLAVGLWLAFEPREHPAAGGGRLAERARAGPPGGPPFKRRELLIRTRGTLRGFTPRADLRGRRRGLACLTLGERPVDDNLGNDAGLDVGVVNASVVSFIPEPRVHAAPSVAPAAGRAVHLRAGLWRAGVLLAVPPIGVRAARRRRFGSLRRFGSADGIAARDGGFLIPAAAARRAAGKLRRHLLAHDHDTLRGVHRLLSGVALGEDIERRREQFHRGDVHLLGDGLRDGARRGTVGSPRSLDAVGEQVVQRVDHAADERLDLLEGSLTASLLRGRRDELERFPGVWRQSTLREWRLGEFVEELAYGGRGDTLAFHRVFEELRQGLGGEPPRGALLPRLGLGSLLVAGGVVNLGRRRSLLSDGGRSIARSTGVTGGRSVIHAAVQSLLALDVIGSHPAAAAAPVGVPVTSPAAAAAMIVPIAAARRSPRVPEPAPAPVAASWPVVLARPPVVRRAPVTAASQPIPQVHVAAGRRSPIVHRRVALARVPPRVAPRW